MENPSDTTNESGMELQKKEMGQAPVIQQNGVPTLMVLNDQQKQEVDRIVTGFEFTEVGSGSIIELGFKAEQGLQKTLDGFLARLDKNTSFQVFELFERLEKGVKDANLPEVLRIVQENKPSLLRRFIGFLKGKSLSQITRESFENIKEMISGRTHTLANEVGKLEKELGVSMRKLSEELQSLEELKDSYHDNLSAFGIEAIAAQVLLEKARVYVREQEEIVANLTSPDPQRQTQLRELQQKLQLLESRSLSLVGAYTRLPADHMIIQQIEQAGVATLQETAITASSRFASIKTTLLALNAAFNVKSVQQMSDKQAEMDRQLQQIRSQLTKEIVTTAATAPGDNRLEQAAQIEKIIQEANEIKALVKAAQTVNSQKFDLARERFAAARKQLSNS